MAFRKTSIAVDTRVLDQEETRKVASGRASPPSNPRIGQRWEDMVWDGFAWVDEAVWRARQAAEG